MTMDQINDITTTRPGTLNVGGRLVAAVALCAGLSVSIAGAQELNAQGWSVFEPSDDTRFIFVSESEGNDLNSGLSPMLAVKTLSRAKDLVRNDSADWVLLKRGDVWNEGFGWWDASGRSDSERIVITTYGDDDARPKLVISEGRAIGGKFHRDVGNVAIIGLDIEADRAGTEGISGVTWLSTGENLLIEDCSIQGFKDNVTCQASDGQFVNFALRRSVIADSWSVGSHSQGLYVSNTQGVVIEENVFDHNGWNDTISGAEPTVYNQNVYLQTSTTGTEFHGNLTARASGAGVQMRRGGNASHNLAYANPLGIRFGYGSLSWPDQAATGRLEQNVVLGGDLPNDSLLGSGTGVWFERAKDVIVEDNVVAQLDGGSVNWAYSFHGYAGGIEFLNNVSSEWGVGIKLASQVDGDVRVEGNHLNTPGANRILEVWHMNGVEFADNDLLGFGADDDAFFVEGDRLNFDEWASLENVDGDEMGQGAESTSRNLDQYAQMIGFSDAQAFLEAARGQSRRNWDSRLTGRAASDWIRQGYVAGN
ncbi:MAG: hypothetical protein ACWA5W_03370 [Phycisphaerales bacterium]